MSAEINQPFAEGAYLVHGFTSGGNPLACAAGSAVIDILRDEQLIENCREQSEVLFSHRDALMAHPTVRDVRGWGLFMVLELIKDKNTLEFFDRDQQAEKLWQALALKNGLALYGSLYGPRRQPAFKRGIPAWISPPLSITSEQVFDLMERLEATLSEWEAVVLPGRVSATA